MAFRSSPSRFFYRAWFAAGVVAIIGGLATYGLYWIEQRNGDEEIRRKIEEHSNVEYPELRQRLQAHLDGLDVLRGLFSTQRLIAPEKFQAAASETAERFPAFTSIRWSPAVKNSERAVYEEVGRQLAGSDFRIHSAATTESDPRAETFPTFFEFPAGAKAEDLGHNLGETDLAAALKEARTSRRAVAAFASKPDGASDLVLIAPVFAIAADNVQRTARGDFLGFVSASIAPQSLFSKPGNSADTSGDLLVIDATPGQTPAQRLVYARASRSDISLRDANAFNGDVYREWSVDFGGRRWLVRKRANPAWVEAQRAESRPYTWLGGAAATLLLAGFVAKALGRTNSLEDQVTIQAAQIETLQETIREDTRVKEHADALLRSSQQQLHALMENSPSGIFMKDSDGRYIAVNRRYAEMHGREREHFVGKSDLDLFPPEVASRLRLSDTRVLSSGRAIEIEDSVTVPSGQLTSIVHKFPLVDETGNIQGLCGIATDISERKRAEAEVRESRRQLESLLGQLPGMAFRFINDGNFTPVYVSRGALGLTGYTARDFVEGLVKFDSVIHPEDRERSRASIAAATKKRRSFEVEYRIIDRSGKVKWVLARGQGVYDEDGRLLFIEGLAIDITQRKDAEAEKLIVERRLLEGQKLESIGVLAGGIAHDFNNLLTGIIGNANLAAVELPPTSRLQQNLRQIEIASQRAAELCQQMLAYAGKGRFMIHRVELGSLVENTVPLLRASISKRAQLKFELTPGLPATLADPTQMRQIVMNLVINASEALGDHDGEIVLSTKLMRPTAADFPAGSVVAPPEFGADFVCLQVRDTGCGMTPETMAKIFDPFFTTKFAGRGLGLAAVQGIIRSHKGGLKVVSAPGKGSTFTLLFPVATGPIEPGPVIRRGTSAPWRSEGLVLIIDDEDHVRNVTADMLRNCGLKTEVARDGYEGLDLFRAKPTEFDLVLLDMTMPRLSGEETLQLLREVYPEVRVLFMSGYNRREVVDALAGSGALSFIQKPFTLESLRDQLQTMLS